MDPLHELLVPYLQNVDITTVAGELKSPVDTFQAADYLDRLSTLSLADLTSTEPSSLLHHSQSLLRDLQALSKRSHRAIIASSSQHSRFSSLLPTLESEVKALDAVVPGLETEASHFARKYDRRSDNTVLDKRNEALLLSRNIDRTSDVLELPSLLSSTIAAAQIASAVSSSVTSASYGTALDLHAHIRRLTVLYPHSGLVSDISKQAEGEMQRLTSILITSLQNTSLKLAGAMRIMGWLRRIAPDLVDDGVRTQQTVTSAKTLILSDVSTGSYGALGSLFLISRTRTLIVTIEALEPLRDLADQETARRKSGVRAKLLQQQVTASSLGSQSERFLKRYIEVFREQSFNTISMYKSIFPAGLPTVNYNAGNVKRRNNNPEQIPSPLAGFSLFLVDLLAATLREYMPNITDRQTRESLLTQVLYCAGSLSRLGADFSMIIALLADDIASDTDDHEQGTSDPEWVQMMVKHRVQSSRLKVLARGVDTARKGSSELQSPPASAIVGDRARNEKFLPST